MRTEMIAIGSELLNAGRIDTNSIWIANRLAELGLELYLKSCVGDDYATLRACIGEALGRSDMIITTGGLGPTFDDQTKEAFAEVVGVPMLEDPQMRSEIESFFSARGLTTPECNYKQALIPSGAIAISNPIGTAPGVYWENPPCRNCRRIIMLPGVQREMIEIWTNGIQPRLSNLIEKPIITLRLVVSGVGESVLDERTKRIRELHSHLDWTILAPRTHVEFLIRSTSAEQLEAVRRDMSAELGADLVCSGNGRPESVVLDILNKRGETLAIAESVTGGILASRLVDVSGASRTFLGGVVAYTPKAKAELLGIPVDFINSNGTVGEAITLEMAARIRERMGAVWGLAITGNAGPTADENALNQDECNKIGRCYIAVAGAAEARCKAHNIHGDRADIQFRATNWAIDMLRRNIL